MKRSELKQIIREVIEESITGNKPELVLKLDPSNSMAQVEVDGKMIFIGNTWDYHNGCCGSKFTINGEKIVLPEFNSVNEFVKVVKNKLNIDDHKVDRNWNSVG